MLHLAQGDLDAVGAAVQVDQPPLLQHVQTEHGAGGHLPLAGGPGHGPGDAGGGILHHGAGGRLAFQPAVQAHKIAALGEKEPGLLAGEGLAPGVFVIDRLLQLGSGGGQP